MLETCRYVVLHHTGGSGGSANDHFDLMIEMPGVAGLKTWRITEPPEHWNNDTTAEPIGDHRKDYLNYEGEISGGRGRVTRVAQGNATVQAGSFGTLHVTFAGDITREIDLPDA